jgi:hypothetical protein
MYTSCRGGVMAFEMFNMHLLFEKSKYLDFPLITCGCFHARNYNFQLSEESAKIIFNII